MDEKSLKSRIKKLSIAVVIISFAILIAVVAASYNLRTILQDALFSQMESETEQYGINIRRQMDADIQTLNTLASFIQYGNMDTDSFIKGFQLSREYNDFDGLGFFGRPDMNIDIGIMITSDAVEEVSVEAQDENMAAVVQDAWNGGSGISRIYTEEDTDENMFAYAVPVYADKEVAGALVAEVGTDVFADVLQDRSVLHGSGYIHLISDSGKILVRSEERVIEEELDTIYDNDYIAQEEQENIKDALIKGESCFSEFTYNGEIYQVLLAPLGVNGWYLFCVQTAQSISGSIYHLMTNTQIITVVVLFIILIIIAYGYRIIYRSNHNLIKSAWYDPLTGAYNMAKFEYETAGIIENTYEYSLAAMNIRQFKFINEIFGTRAADLLLCHMKSVIADNVTENEYYCRNSEDMFYLLLRDTDRDRIKERIGKMIQEISRYAICNNRDYRILLYCGVVIGTDVEDEEPSVKKSMTHVRFALDTARQSLKNNIWFYDTRLHEDEKLQNYVESHMNQALDNHEFKLYLQPKVNLSTGRTSGAEALVRWIAEEGRIIYPGQFIPVFEANGFCVNLDMYMLEEVCRQIRKWIDDGLTPVPVSVNQSKLLFYEADYIDNLKSLLDKYQIPAELISLEILEGLASENVNELNKRIGRLREIGFKISLDDFGSGYSSMNTLASLEIDELKFDRGFLLGLKDSGEEYERQIIIMNEIVELTKKLKISTVVEGVETKENEELVRALGCEYGQGYYYSMPMSASEFSEKYVKNPAD
ncbi:MAG TPA: GGDEF domain-containing protein [Candidatus Mediterraneibacter intestinigallinarum]|nr:GGDEF domain-containing protein [Candidatus Mediterraneibacter intestinigallinarum]